MICGEVWVYARRDKKTRTFKYAAHREVHGPPGADKHL